MFGSDSYLHRRQLHLYPCNELRDFFRSCSIILYFPSKEENSNSSPALTSLNTFKTQTSPFTIVSHS